VERTPNYHEYAEWTGSVEHGSISEADNGSVGNKLLSFYGLWAFSSFSQKPSLIPY
jgi:hypothetical protein